MPLLLARVRTILEPRQNCSMPIRLSRCNIGHYRQFCAAARASLQRCRERWILLMQAWAALPRIGPSVQSVLYLRAEQDKAFRASCECLKSLCRSPMLQAEQRPGQCRSCRSSSRSANPVISIILHDCS